MTRFPIAVHFPLLLLSKEVSLHCVEIGFNTGVDRGNIDKKSTVCQSSFYIYLPTKLHNFKVILIAFHIRGSISVIAVFLPQPIIGLFTAAILEGTHILI